MKLNYTKVGTLYIIHQSAYFASISEIIRLVGYVRRNVFHNLSLSSIIIDNIVFTVQKKPLSAMIYCIQSPLVDDEIIRVFVVGLFPLDHDTPVTQLGLKYSRNERVFLPGVIMV